MNCSSFEGDTPERRLVSDSKRWSNLDQLLPQFTAALQGGIVLLHILVVLVGDKDFVPRSAERDKRGVVRDCNRFKLRAGNVTVKDQLE